MSRAIHAALAGTLLLTGCAGPAVRTEKVADVTPPAAWRTDAGPTTPLDNSWWQAFSDPALTRLVETALANNTDIGIAVARVRESQANAQLAHAQLFPTVDLVAGGARSRSVSAFGQPQLQTAAQPQIQIAYELDLFGRISDLASAARSAYLSSVAARDAARLAVASVTANSYIVLLGLDARREVVRATLAARAESLKLAQRRVESGYSPRLELQQAQAEYDATAQILPQLDQAIAQTENALSVLTGTLPTTVQRGSLSQLAKPTIPNGLPSSLLRRRPDIAQAELALAAADSSLAAARRRFLPRVQLTAAAGAAFSTLLRDDPISVWSVGGSILAPLFQGGRLTAQAEAAGAQRDQAAFAYRKAALTGFREVEDALVSVERLDGQVALATHQRDTLAEALRLATNRYREGYSPYLEQLDAQRSLLGSELSLVQLRTDVLAARIQLYRALGGGWSADSLTAAEHQ